MYCKNCGSILEDTDTVCKNCGAQVNISDAESQTETPNTDSGQQKETIKVIEPSSKSRNDARDEDFKWDTNDFPKDVSPKKQEEVKFKWDEEEKSQPQDSPEYKKAQWKKEELFTFSEKKEEFQNLLDEEYEKIKSGNKEFDQPKNQSPDDTKTVAGMNIFAEDVASPLGKAPEAKVVSEPLETPQQQIPQEEKPMTWTDTRPYKPIRKPEPTLTGEAKASDTKSTTAEDTITEETTTGDTVGEDTAAEKATGIPTMDNPSQQWADGPKDASITKKPVVFPFEMDDADGETGSQQNQQNLQNQPDQSSPETESKDATQAAPSQGEPASEPPREPAQEPNQGQAPDPNAQTNYPAYDDDEPPKRTGMKVFITILIILIVAAGAAFGIAKLAPDSAAGVWINGLFDGSNTATDEGYTEEEQIEFLEPRDDKATMVTSQLFNNKNIEDVKYDDTLKFDSNHTYTLAGVNESLPVENDFWYEDDGVQYLYEESAVGAVIAFCSNWVPYVNDSTKDIFENIKEGSEAETKVNNYEKVGKIIVEFTLLEIGEVRQDEKGLYVWVREHLNAEENGTTKEVIYERIYYVEPDSDKMVVVNYQ